MRNKFTVVKLVEDKHYELQTYIFKWRGFLKNEKKCSCPQISRNFFVPPKNFWSRFFFIRIYFIRISRLKMAKKLRIIFLIKTLTWFCVEKMWNCRLILICFLPLSLWSERCNSQIKLTPSVVIWFVFVNISLQILILNRGMWWLVRIC